MVDLNVRTEANELQCPLLTLQTNHRSHFATKNCKDQVLKCRRYDKKFWQAIPFHPRVEAYIFRAGFEGIYRACNQLGQLKCDQALITAFVERWRQETHTFWMPFGEVGITLQDVEVIWGLKVDGHPVIGHERARTTAQWQEICQELIGFTPPENQFDGSRLNTNSFADVAELEIPADASEIQFAQRARMRLLQLFGGLLFADKSGNKVNLSLLELIGDFDEASNYSWGSAVLACLYRNLCHASLVNTKDMAGPAVLLQLWVWERFPTIRPEIRQPLPSLPQGGPLAARWHTSLSRKGYTANVLRGYRDSLDGLSIQYFIWMPYTPLIIESLPAYCKAGHGIWKSRVPLIFFHMVEMHLPDRVLRQFGQFQSVPRHPDTFPVLHNKRALVGHNWATEHSTYIEMWQRRHRHIAASHDTNHVSTTSPEYLEWYRQHYIGPLSAIGPNLHPDGFEGSASVDQYLTSFLRKYYSTASDLLQRPDLSFNEIRGFIEQFRADCRYAFCKLGRLSTLQCGTSVHDATMMVVARPSVSILGRRHSSDRPSTDRQPTAARSTGARHSSLHVPDDAPAAT